MTGHTRIQAHISTIDPGDRIDHAGLTRCVVVISANEYGHVLIRFTDGHAATFRPDAYVDVFVVSNRDVPSFVGGGEAA